MVVFLGLGRGEDSRFSDGRYKPVFGAGFGEWQGDWRRR